MAMCSQYFFIWTGSRGMLIWFMLYFWKWPTPTKHVINGQTSDIRRIFPGNEIVDHSDVVGASPVGTAPTTSSLQLASVDWASQLQGDARNI